jgi:AcrR family transcriptional regulator
MDVQTISSDEDIKLTKGQKRRAEIISLGRNLLIEEGYDAFVLRTVAAQAEITLGNLQYYFPMREDLLEAIGNEEFSRGLEIVRNASNGSGAPEDRLAEMVRGLVGEWHQTGGRVYAVIAMLAMHQERFKLLHSHQYRLFYRAVAELLTAINPDAEDKEALHQARLITSMMDGSLFQVALGGKGYRAERKRFHEEIVTAILKAVAS